MARDQLVPDLLARRAAEVLDDGAGHVEHDVCDDGEVADVAEVVAHAAWDEEVDPLEEDTGFEEHDYVAVDDVRVVDLLGGSELGDRWRFY